MNRSSLFTPGFGAVRRRIEIDDRAAGRLGKRIADPAVARAGCLALSPDTRCLATAHGEATVLIRDVAALPDARYSGEAHAVTVGTRPSGPSDRPKPWNF